MSAEDAHPADDRVLTNAELVAATGAGLRWITYTRIVLELALLVAVVVLARLIPPSAFGTFAIVVIFQELAMSVPGEGIGSAIVQRASIERAHLQGGLAASMLMGMVLAGAACLLALTVVAPLYGDGTADLVLLASPCFLLGAVVAIPQAQLRRRLDFKRLSRIELASSLVRVAATVGLALAGLDATALVLGYLAGTVTGAALTCVAQPPLAPRWRHAAVRELLVYGGPASLASVAWAAFRNGDYAIIGARLGAAQAGFYWRAYQLAVEYQRKISVVMTQMAFPVLARASGNDEMLALRRRMVIVLTTVLFPLLVVLALLAPTLVPWLFGPRWEPAVLPTQILAGGGAATLVIDAIGSAIMAQGRSKALLGYGIAHFVVYAGAVFAVASRGLAAVAIAAAVVHTIFLFVAYQLLIGGRFARALRAMWQDLAAATTASAGLACVAGPVAWLLSPEAVSTPLYLAAVTVAGAIAYLVILRSLFHTAFADLGAVVRQVAPVRLQRIAATVRLPPWSRRPTSETG